MKKIILITLLAISSLVASLKVDTTYSTFGEITKQVGGDLVEVSVLGRSK